MIHFFCYVAVHFYGKFVFQLPSQSVANYCLALISIIKRKQIFYTSAIIVLKALLYTCLQLFPTSSMCCWLCSLAYDGCEYTSAKKELPAAEFRAYTCSEEYELHWSGLSITIIISDWNSALTICKRFLPFCLSCRKCFFPLGGYSPLKNVGHFRRVLLHSAGHGWVLTTHHLTRQS